jgi:acetylornithine/succinyldiaminopimelate/putrescine aminotransferase
LIPGVTSAPSDDPAAADALIGHDTAAVIVEPIQGEGGVRPIAPAMAGAIAAACRRSGALLIADEVQTGCGRTGAFLASPALGLTPDLVALGKALGAGFPVGAAMVSRDVAAAVSAGDHGTTYGGNLLACRAALTFLEELDRGVLAAIPRLSAYLFARLRELAARHSGAIVDVRGAGLMAGLQCAADSTPVVAAALDRGLLVNRTAATVVRLLPAYIVTEGEIDEAVAILDQVFSEGAAS